MTPSESGTVWQDGQVEVRSLGWAAELEAGFSIHDLLSVGAPQVGELTLSPTGSGGAELSVSLAPPWQGRRFASRAARLVLDWALEQGNLNVISYRIDVGDYAARRLAWALGFSFSPALPGLGQGDGEIWYAWLRAGEPMVPQNAWLELPELIGTTASGAPVRLRDYQDSDYQRMLEACTDAETRRWIRLPDPYTLASAREHAATGPLRRATGEALVWIVADARNECVGEIALFRAQGGAGLDAEIGYWAHPGARGRGYLTAATALVRRHGLMDLAEGGLGLPRVTARVSDQNLASQHVVLGAGMAQIAVLPSSMRLGDGSLSTALLFASLAEDLRAPC